MVSIQSGIDINLLAALNVTREFAPALIESHGSVVMVTSMVLRNQLPGFGGAYRIMKSGSWQWHAVCRSISVPRAFESIRLLPAISGRTRSRTCSRRRRRRQESTPKVIYDEIAAGADLRRLPEPDDIANAVVFLLSDSARAITGQCLDVNCGHTHH